ncbi:hypothetical protein GCM10011348_23920 [Marinobacterium nitratireducens]|uniref:Toxin CptA n=1 Tax=Marinobacterium nitratireducens TaxID=518897 RepID=A0A917ZGF1_9GAMM|nr:protein YgfX [Marinobacterium nitratireducens]GGO82465.1 hypothetical protein GCM10011348_23920 [Marinobacterium nitratireducens]
MFSPIEVAIGPSRRLCWLSAAAHLCLLALLGLSSLPPYVLVPALPAVSLHGYCMYRRLAGMAAGLRWDADLRQLAVRERGADWRPVEQVESVAVLPWLLIIRLRQDGRRRRLVIAADSLSAEAFRRLSVVARLAPISEPDRARGS